MAKGIQRRLTRALEAAYREMAQHDGSKYARGLAAEGWMGGYIQALSDVQLLLSGVEPNDDLGFWRDMPPNV